MKPEKDNYEDPINLFTSKHYWEEAITFYSKEDLVEHIPRKIIEILNSALQEGIKECDIWLDAETNGFRVNYIKKKLELLQIKTEQT